jgi:hypothetical protein
LKIWEIRYQINNVISPYKIRGLFGESFRIDSIKETVYQGTLDPFPKALFVVMDSPSYII